MGGLLEDPRVIFGNKAEVSPRVHVGYRADTLAQNGFFGHFQGTADARESNCPQ